MGEEITGLAALGLNEVLPESVESDQYAAHVGARVAAARKRRNLTGTELGAMVGLRKDQISKIESGRRRLDVSELPRVAAALGVSVRSLLGQSDRPALAMAGRLAAGAGPDAMHPARRRARQLLEIDDLLTQATDMPSARPSPQGRGVVEQVRAGFPAQPRSKAAAQRQGRELAELTRRELDLGSDALGDVAGLIEQHFGVDVALSPLGADVGGLCVHSGADALILASTDCSDGRVRFTLAHELGHHLLADPREVIEEAERDMFSDSDVEWRANAFAGHFLMPEPGVRSVLAWLGEESGKVSERAAVGLMEHFGVSMAALLYQLDTIGALSYNDAQELHSRGVTSLVARHRDVAPSRSAIAAGRIRRPPERLIRQAIAAARGQRLGLSVVAALLERDDDDQLWNDIMTDHVQATSSSDIVL